MLKLRFDSVNGKTYEQISKNKARKLFLNGQTVVLCPSNLRPFTTWHSEYFLSRDDKNKFFVDDIGAENYFNDTCNSFAWYNCISNETGKYIRFYAEV